MPFLKNKRQIPNLEETKAVESTNFDGTRVKKKKQSWSGCDAVTGRLALIRWQGDMLGRALRLRYVWVM